MAAMHEIGEGRRGLRAPEDGPSELRGLAASMNRMMDRREASEAKLETQRREQVRLEEKLRHSEKLAAIGQLAAGMAHELGTPLGSVAGRVQRATRHLPADGPARKEMIAVQVEIERIERIVRQLLDFARRNPLQPRPVDLAQLLGDLVERVRGRHSDSSLEFHVEGESLTVLADRLRLGQALENLLENAAQAAASRVSVRWAVLPDQVQVVVADDGPRAGRGISDEQATRLFEPFFTTKPTGEGTGLGLAVVQVALEDHGGTIALDRSIPGETRFVICLPGSISAGISSDGEQHGSSDE
jgi:signal transduction histidine kinase